VTKVVSHPHAMPSCRKWLRNNLPGREVEAANSTGRVERVASVSEPWAPIATGWPVRLRLRRVGTRSRTIRKTRPFVFLAAAERQDLFEPYKTSVVCEIAKDSRGLLLILQEFRSSATST